MQLNSPLQYSSFNNKIAIFFPPGNLFVYLLKFVPSTREGKTYLLFTKPLKFQYTGTLTRDLERNSNGLVLYETKYHVDKWMLQMELWSLTF